MKTHSIENRCHIEAENILFAGMSVHFSPEILLAGAVKGLIMFCYVSLRFIYILLPLLRPVVYLSFLIVSFE